MSLFLSFVDKTDFRLNSMSVITVRILLNFSVSRIIVRQNYSYRIKLNSTFNPLIYMCIMDIVIERRCSFYKEKIVLFKKNKKRTTNILQELCTKIWTQ